MRTKGLAGKLIEVVLGADAGCQSRPDFTLLDIELKTLPINRHGRPAESTYVCTVPLKWHDNYQLENSLLWKKLKKILWIPIESAKNKPIELRRIFSPILWEPQGAILKTLKEDWNDITEELLSGGIEHINSKMGTYLHIRPKAAHSRSLTQTLDINSTLRETLPRGFYLRTTLTQKILANTALNRDTV